MNLLFTQEKLFLNGLSPKQNREIPPLDYDIVGSLKKRRSDLKIILNVFIMLIIGKVNPRPEAYVQDPVILELYI